jgi:hypothetical protein
MMTGLWGGDSIDSTEAEAVIWMAMELSWDDGRRGSFRCICLCDVSACESFVEDM